MKRHLGSRRLSQVAGFTCRNDVPQCVVPVSAQRDDVIRLKIDGLQPTVGASPIVGRFHSLPLERREVVDLARGKSCEAKPLPIQSSRAMGATVLSVVLSLLFCPFRILATPNIGDSVHLADLLRVPSLIVTSSIQNLLSVLGVVRLPLEQEAWLAFRASSHRPFSVLVEGIEGLIDAALVASLHTQIVPDFLQESDRVKPSL